MPPIGVYFGGTAVFSLAGAAYDPESFAHMCDAAETVDCAWFDEIGVSPTSADPALLSRRQADPRITAGIAIEPEYTGFLSVASLAALRNPVDVVRLGAGGSPIAEWAPVHEVPQAGEMDGFGPCTPKGGAILAEEGGDPQLCEGEEERRAAAHDAIAETVTRILYDVLR